MSDPAIVMISRHIASCVAFAAAAYVAAKGKDGWGWLIFAGIIIA